MTRLDVRLDFEISPDLSLHICEDGCIPLDVGQFVGGAWPMYDGPYTVIPRAWQEQVLPTERRSLIDDVTVTEIPYLETSNPYGRTASIGS